MLRILPPTSPLELTVETIKHVCIMLSLFLSTRCFFFLLMDKLSTMLADSRICIFLKRNDSHFPTCLKLRSRMLWRNNTDDPISYKN